MDKEQILEMIDGTFIPNNVKGITAQGVKNVLKEMVNFTPESSGGGGGGISFFLGSVTMEDMENVDPETLMIYPNLTDSQREHNATMFNQFLESACIPSVSVDMTEYYLNMMGFPPEIASGIKVGLQSGMTMYYPEEIAAEMGGLDQACVICQIDGLPCIIKADGSSIIAFGE